MSWVVVVAFAWGVVLLPVAFLTGWVLIRIDRRDAAATFAGRGRRITDARPAGTGTAEGEPLDPRRSNEAAFSSDQQEFESSSGSGRSLPSSGVHPTS
jgi:hypothetical protein